MYVCIDIFIYIRGGRVALSCSSSSLRCSSVADMSLSTFCASAAAWSTYRDVFQIDDDSRNRNSLKYVMTLESRDSLRPSSLGLNLTRNVTLHLVRLR